MYYLHVDVEVLTTPCYVPRYKTAFGRFIGNKLA